jgi:glycosyltransferase involved in cell wall biosynthesis
MRPLVSVICVCYNHERYVVEALESVTAQTYPNIEIIIVDDGSTDSSVSKIKQWVSQNPNATFLDLKINHGYCKAFNAGLALAKGQFIIDMATDDVFLPKKIEHQVILFSTLGQGYGVVFTDAEYVDSEGKFLRDHFAYLKRKGLISEIPQGDVYRAVLERYYIPSPTMMIRKEVFGTIGGYDESLSYEDFDFWVRSSRIFKYAFLNEKSVLIRRKTKSMSSGWYKAGDPQLMSTYQVCKKAKQLNRDDEDKEAWRKRVRYELRQSVFSENFKEARLFFELLREDNGIRWQDNLVCKLGQLQLPLFVFRNFYQRMRYQLLE